MPDNPLPNSTAAELTDATRGLLTAVHALQAVVDDLAAATRDGNGVDGEPGQAGAPGRAGGGRGGQGGAGGPGGRGGGDGGDGGPGGPGGDA